MAALHALPQVGTGLRSQGCTVEPGGSQTGAGQLLASVRERFPDLPFGLVWEHLQDAAPYRALGWFDGRSIRRRHSAWTVAR